MVYETVAGKVALGIGTGNEVCSCVGENWIKTMENLLHSSEFELPRNPRSLVARPSADGTVSNDVERGDCATCMPYLFHAIALSRCHRD